MLWRKKYEKIVFIFICFFLSLGSFSEALIIVAEFDDVEGRVDVLREGTLPAIPVDIGDPVYEKDIVRTKNRSVATILFNDGTTIMLAERSRVDIEKYQLDKKRVIKLPRGKIRAKVRNRGVKFISVSDNSRGFEIHTPNAVAGVRGTDFLVLHDQGGTKVLVKEGNVYLYNQLFPREVIPISAGNISMVLLKSPPTEARLVTKTEIITYKRGFVDIEEISNVEEDNFIDDFLGEEDKNDSKRIKKIKDRFKKNRRKNVRREPKNVFDWNPIDNIDVIMDKINPAIPQDPQENGPATQPPNPDPDNNKEKFNINLEWPE